MTRQEFSQKIAVFLVKRDWNLPKLANAASLQAYQIRDFLNNKTNKVQVGVAICEALNLDISMAYKTCGLPLPQQANPQGDKS